MIAVAGGFNDFSEGGSYEHANMGATSNSHTEFAMGRELNDMSHPTASTRDGVSHRIVGITDILSLSSRRSRIPRTIGC